MDCARPSPHSADRASANASRKKAKPSLVYFLVSLHAASAAPGLRSGQHARSTSKKPAYTPSDGFLAVSFDNLGAGAHLALCIAEASHRTQVPRNCHIEHLPARAGHTRTRSARNAPESTLPRPQARQEQKTSTLRRAAPNKPWRTRTSSSSSRPRASEM